jgi:hypothetical protein
VHAPEALASKSLRGPFVSNDRTVPSWLQQGNEIDIEHSGDKLQFRLDLAGNLSGREIDETRRDFGNRLLELM